MPHSETHDQAIAQRQRELIRSARSDAARLRQGAEANLSYHAPPDSPVTGDCNGLAPAGPPPDSFTGYQILGELHRGGQGIVYEAVQKSTRRKVAIKVMKEGPFASPVDKARFDREVQTLGQLKHPAIVAVHGTGVAAGHFYFVMDYVHGQPLDVYVSGATRSIDEIIGLFVKICEAVHAAHLRGIIHRDLKPTNVRVDDSGNPHVLDFGLAKVATGVDMAGITATGQFVGSLPWASPEQAQGAHSDMDVRTDVYSLGVMMFQMLTGRFPYEIIGSLPDILDQVIHAEPARPSSVRNEINDEVETIVLKCLQKDRDLRYQSAGEVARDLRRYLSGDPIEAKRESAVYVLRKQLRKHRISVVIALGFMATVAAGLIASAMGWRTAATQRDAAIAARDEANAVTAFLTDMLSKPNPYSGADREVTVREVVDQASRQVDVSFADQPMVQAGIHSTLAATYEALALFEPARRHFEAALALRRRHRGAHSPETATSLCQLAGLEPLPVAEELARECLSIRQMHFGPRHLEVAQSLYAVGLVLYRQGRLAEAESLLRQALEQQVDLAGAAGRGATVARRILAVVVRDQGRYSEAEPLFRQNLELQIRAFGEKNADSANTMAELGELLHFLGQDDEAQRIQRRVLDIRREAWGDEHHTVANSLSNLALLHGDRGEYQEAETLYRESLALRAKLEGPRSVSVTYPMIGLGRIYLRQGRPAEAEPLLRESVDILAREAPDHWRIGYAQGLLGACLAGDGRQEEGKTRLLEGLALMRRSKKETDRLVQEIGDYLRELYATTDGPDAMPKPSDR